MTDPVWRRVDCAATVYWEMDPGGPRVARVVIDLPLPPLEDPDHPAELVDAAAAAALSRWMLKDPYPPRPPAAPLVPDPNTARNHGAWEVAG